MNISGRVQNIHMSLSEYFGTGTKYSDSPGTS